jgi:hypothetical protein
VFTKTSNSGTFTKNFGGEVDQYKKFFFMHFKCCHMLQVVRAMEKEKSLVKWSEKSVPKAVGDVTFGSAGVQSVVYLISGVCSGAVG